MSLIFIIVFIRMGMSYSYAELSLPKSTILFVRGEVGDTEGEIKDEQIWYMSDKSQWIPEQLTRIKGHIREPRLSPKGNYVLWFSPTDSFTYDGQPGAGGHSEGRHPF